MSIFVTTYKRKSGVCSSIIKFPTCSKIRIVLENKNKKVLVVFDFDKTITTKHTFWRFLKFVTGTVYFGWLFFRHYKSILEVLRKKKEVMKLREEVLLGIFKNYSQEKYLLKSKQFANTKIKDWINETAIKKLEFHKSQNHFVVLLSNATETYLKEWAKDYDFDLILGTRLEMVDGKLTGRVDGGDCFGYNKVKRLEEIVGTLSDYELHIYGDSRGDAELLSKAEYPFYRNFEEPRFTNLPYHFEDTDESHEILIVGAGPVGLTLACELARHDIKFRIIEKAVKQHQGTRAFALHSRSLEVFSIMGIADELVEKGRIINAARILYNDKPIFNTDFTKLDSDYPFVLCIPQYVIESVLEKYLWRKYKVSVERGIALDEIHYPLNELPEVLLLDQNGEQEALRPSWVIAADGARSPIRKKMGLTFEGDCFGTAFIILDAAVKFKETETIDTFLNNKGYLLLAPFPDNKYHRLVIEVPLREDDELKKVTPDEVDKLLKQNGYEDVQVKEILWLSKTRVQRRIVENFKVGRVLLAGDAAHINSPVGGQGMNLGVRDAFNLGWKLAFVVSGKADASLLYSYHNERSKIAHKVLKGTNKLNRILSARGVKRNMRNVLLRVLNRFPKVNKGLATMVSGIGNSYPDSMLTAGQNWPALVNVRPGARCLNGTLYTEDQQKTEIYDLLKYRTFLLFICVEETLSESEQSMLYEAVELFQNYFQNTVRVYFVLKNAHMGWGNAKKDILLYDTDSYFADKINLSRGLCLVRPDGYFSLVNESYDLENIQHHLSKFLFVKTEIPEVV